MSKIIKLPGSSSPVEKPELPNNVITNGPLRLRWGDWRTNKIIQVHVGPAAAFEDHRAECFAKGLDHTGDMPSHFALDGPSHDTALALLRHRNDAEKLIQVNYLAAMMEALVNTPCAILRTDLIRRVYREVEVLGKALGLSWHAVEGRFLLPLDEDAQNPEAFSSRLSRLDNLSEFFAVLKDVAQRRHDILAKKYVLYYPRQKHL